MKFTVAGAVTVMVEGENTSWLFAPTMIVAVDCEGVTINVPNLV